MPTYLFTAKPNTKSTRKAILIAFPSGVEVQQATQYVNENCQGDYERRVIRDSDGTPQILCEEMADDAKGMASLEDGEDDDLNTSADEVLA